MTQPSSTDRPVIRYIDYLKGGLMLLVVLGHIVSRTGAAKAWIYGFHMPAFFFASGLLLRDGAEYGFEDALSDAGKRFKRLMWPCFLWAVIYASLNPKNLALIGYASHQTFSRAGALSSLWFLPVLFVAGLLYSLCRVVLGKHFGLIAKMVLIPLAFLVGEMFPPFRGGYPWGVNLAFWALGFMLLGHLASAPIARLSLFVKQGRWNRLAALLLAIVGLAGTMAFQFNRPGGAYVNFSGAMFGHPLLFVLVACAGILLSVAVSVLLDTGTGDGRFWRWLEFVGRNSLCVFVVHKPLILLFRQTCRAMSFGEDATVVVSCMGTLAASCLLAMVFNRFCPTALGKFPRRDAIRGT